MSASSLPLRKQTYSKTLIAIGIAVTALFVVTFLLVMRDTKQREYDKAQQTAQSIVGTITADLARNIEVYDLSLQAVIDNLKHPGVDTMDPAMRQDLLFDRSATAKYLGSIFVLDKTGNLLLDSRTTTIVPRNDVHKEYFQFHLNDASEGAHIGRPWTDVNGERFISISRRIAAPDGSFNGAVVGTLNLTYFIDLFNKVHLHDGDTLNLVQADGRIVMRAPFNADVIDADLSASTMFQRMAREGTGSFVSNWSRDGVERLFVFQQVGSANLIMYYSLPLASIYAGWWSQTLRLLAIVALVSATNVLLITFLARSLKRSAKAEYNLALAALTDSLTGLFNRRHFDKMLDDEWRLAMRGQTPVGVLMIDADNFKAFNDGFGHQAGDTALVAIARCIGGGARCEIDICARYGGEEFAVLLPGVAAKEALGIAERIRESVVDLRKQQGGQADSIPTVSIGVASLIPRPGLQPHDLIQKADIALYHAKARGRNRCELEDAPRTASWLPVIAGAELPLATEASKSRASV